MPTDRVLVEIVTAANMAGIEQAKAGFLGMNIATLGLAASLGVLVMGGKSMIENSRAFEDAELSLTQAVNAYNHNLGKTTKAHSVYIQGSSASARQSETLRRAQEHVTIATNSVRLAQMSYTEAVKKHGATSDQAVKASIRLADARIRLSEAERATGSVTLGSAGYYVKYAGTLKRAAVNLEALKKTFDAWTEANKRYIPDQFAAERALASFVRAGSNAKEAMRLLNDTLDLTIIRGGDMTENAKMLTLALAGNTRGTRFLGITTAELTKITKSHLTTAQKHAALLALIEKKTRDGRKAQDDLKQSSNELNKDWQDLSKKGGRVLTTLLDTVVRGAIAVYDWFDKIGKDNKLWANISGRLVDMAAWIKKYILDPLQWAKDHLGWLVGAPGGPGTGSATPHPPGKASGGPVMSGTTYTVGERGPETLVMGSQGGTIIPHGSGSNRPAEIHIHIERGAYIDGPGIDMLTNRIARRLQFASGQ